MNTNRELFEEAPVPKAVALMAVPTMISMLVVVIYNMADTFFIGQTGDPLQVAAVSLATPIFMIYMALGNLFGIGGSSCAGREADGPCQKPVVLLLLRLYRPGHNSCGALYSRNGFDSEADRSQREYN